MYCQVQKTGHLWKPHRNMKPPTIWSSETHLQLTAASRTSRCFADVRIYPALASWSPEQMQALCFGSNILEHREVIF
ncbi:Mitotic Checkpoint Serine/Threonine-Protein Kinase Bub1 Beta [Manis pentadactyla]|nr:Mitotic Checkpoint Serine/Threonine-Protein Kinase Bub1 Beta [Manis pentadactyla]